MLSERKEEVAEKVIKKKAILIGPTGSGKSTIGCLILGDNEAFLCSSGGDSCTQDISVKSSDVVLEPSQSKLHLSVIDTPGLDDTRGRTSWSLDNIIDQIRTDPPNLIFLILTDSSNSYDRNQRVLSVVRDCLIGVDKSRLRVVLNQVSRDCDQAEATIKPFQKQLRTELGIAISDSHILTLANDPNEDDVLTFQTKARKQLSDSEPAPADFKELRSWTENLTFHYELLNKSKSKEEATKLASKALESELSEMKHKLEYPQRVVQDFKNLKVSDEILAPFNQQVTELQTKIKELEEKLVIARVNVSNALMEVKRNTAHWDKKRETFPCKKFRHTAENPLCGFCDQTNDSHAKEAQQKLAEQKEDHSKKINLSSVGKNKKNSNIAIFSLDYDSCGDIFFEGIRKSLMEVFHLEEERVSEDNLLSLREKLSTFLKEKARLGEKVELYVGSNRQSNAVEQAGHAQNKNGLCFELFPKLCQDNGWTFRPLLLADTQNNKAAGSAIQPDSKLTCWTDSNKINVIKNQLADAAKNHPEDIIDFYFIDDDRKGIILPDLIKHFEQHREDLPSNVRLHFIKFDWMGKLFYGTDALKEIYVSEHLEKMNIQNKIPNDLKEVLPLEHNVEENLALLPSLHHVEDDVAAMAKSDNSISDSFAQLNSLGIFSAQDKIKKDSGIRDQPKPSPKP